MEIATIILIVLNVLFGLFILFGFLWGMKRGVKKSAVRLAFVAGALILAFGISIPVTNALVNMDISSIINQTDSNGEPITNLSQLITSALTSNESIAEAYNNSASFRALVDALPKMILQCVIFVILFWILKMITWVIFAIVAKCIWGKKKKTKEEKLHDKQVSRTVENGRVIQNGNIQPVEAKPAKKHIWAGAAVGTFQGLIIAFCTMIPLAGVASIMSEIDKSSTKSVNAYSQDDSFLNDLQPLGDMIRENVGDEVVDALLAYDKSALGIICGWTGVDDLAFDLQSSAKIGDSTTNLRREINSLVNAYSEFQSLKSLNLSTLDFDTVQKVFDYLFESKALTNIADDLIPFYVNKILNDPNANLDTNIRQVLQMYVDSYNTPTMNDLKNDLNSIIVAMKVIQSNDIFKLIEEDNFSIETLISILEDDGDNTPIKDIFVALTNSSTMQKVLQTAINYGLDYLSTELSAIQGNELTIKHAQFNNVNWDEVNNEIPTVLNNLIQLYKQYNIDGTTDQKIENVDFINIGRTLEIFTSSSLLQEAYDNTIVVLNKVDKYNKFIDFSALNSTLNFEQEFQYLQNSINAMSEVGAISYISNGNFDIKELLKKLGQNINPTQTCIDIITDNLTQSIILQSSIPRTLNVIYSEQIQPKVDYVIDEINQALINWENEKTALSSIINYVSANSKYFLEGINVENIIKNIDLKELGVCLDDMKESQLLYPLYKVGIQIAQNNEEVKNYINTSAINYDTNWTQELESLQKAINVAKDNNILNVIFTENGIKETLTILSTNEEIIAGIIDNLFNSTIMQHSVEQLINKLQNLIGTQLSITIEPTTIDVNNFINNLATKKLEFSNIIYNLAVVSSPIMTDGFNLDTFANNIDNFANAFDSLQQSDEFSNTYWGIINYLSTNESINKVLDFSVVGENFNYIDEFGKIKEIIDILKLNNVWTPLVDGTKTVDEVLNMLDDETKTAVTELILESKLFDGLAVQALNKLIDEFNGYLNTEISHIPEGTDLSTQSENIAQVTKYLLEISNSGTSDIILDNINLVSLGNLLTELKNNKFIYSGVLTEVYNEFVAYMTKDESYGYLIDDACNFFGDFTPNENESVDWIKICNAFDELLKVKDNLDTLDNLTSTEIVAVFNSIGNNPNELVIRLSKTFLKNDKGTEQQQKIDNFDFSDTDFNERAISIIFDIKDTSSLFETDKNSALDTISNAFTQMQELDRTKLNSLVQFIDVVTNNDIYSKIDGVDFNKEVTAINEFKKLLNHTGELTVELLTSSLEVFNTSTMILNELANNNAVILDLQDTNKINSLKKSISNATSIPESSISDEYVKNYVKTLINKKISAEKVSNVTKIFNL